MSKKSFGSLLRGKRLEMGLSLRSFCSRFGFDTAYISRLENGKLLPPSKKEKLIAIAESLGLKKDTSEWVKFFDLAYADRKELPKDVKEEAPEIVSALPAFLRKSDGKIKKERVKSLISFLNEIGDADNEQK